MTGPISDESSAPAGAPGGAATAEAGSAASAGQSAAAIAAEAAVTSPSAAAETEAVEPAAAESRYRGWYWLGIVLQVCVWTLIWLGIAIAVGVGGELTEFRYVGF
jgi:hypothetical protein